MEEIGENGEKKEDFKSIPRNQKSSKSDLISRRNHELKWREFSER